MLDPQKLEECFLEWVRNEAKLEVDDVVSIDGKSIRDNAEKIPHSFVHMISA